MEVTTWVEHKARIVKVFDVGIGIPLLASVERVVSRASLCGTVKIGQVVEVG
jgi:hypothetical protein